MAEEPGGSMASGSRTANGALSGKLAYANLIKSLI
jgi:hypothetical protein